MLEKVVEKPKAGEYPAGLYTDTPVQLIRHPLLTKNQIELWVKRDDLIHPFISGNKWRKLKYIVQEMEKQNKKHLVTFGGPWSNHILAAACAGASFGFRTTAFIRGESVKNPVLAMAKIFGMELIFTDRASFRNPEGLFDGYKEAAGPHQPEDLFYLRQGGHHQLALKGCAEILENLPFSFDKIFCACGTGTTLAGLAMGIAKKRNRDPKFGDGPDLVGIPVIGGGDSLQSEIAALYPEAEFRLLSEYAFGGYARTKHELTAFISDFCSQTGILIEPVYTGKLFYAIFDQINRNEIPKGHRILAIHTGGLTGILGMYEKWL